MSTFEELPYRTAWLGSNPTEKTIQCEFDGLGSDGELPFVVLNGAWDGTLSKKGDDLWIVDSRGEQHGPVVIVELLEQKRDLTYDDDIGICY
ncbi:hypothetical protein EV128_125118 [Rhizobium azibense]|nr:hypothetical protein EV128_125118 [Rhizobium azibense]